MTPFEIVLTSVIGITIVNLPIYLILFHKIDELKESLNQEKRRNDLLERSLKDHHLEQKKLQNQFESQISYLTEVGKKSEEKLNKIDILINNFSETLDIPKDIPAYKQITDFMNQYQGIKNETSKDAPR